MKFTERLEARVGEKVLSGVHESGLRVFVVPKKGFSKFYAVFATEFGSVDNDFTVDSRRVLVPDGTAHFLEHKMFDEKAGGGAFSSFSATGADSNAFTDFHMTAYLFSCTDCFYENLDSLVGFVSRPYYTDANVTKERPIIGQEIKMYDDDPEWRVFFNNLRGLYQKNPINKDIAGTVESIAEITPELLYTCYDSFYRPDNMTLVMVGDIDENRAAEVIDKHVKLKPKREIARHRKIEPAACAQNFVTQKMSVGTPLCEIGFKHSGANDWDLLKFEGAAEILLEALFGKSSPLFMNLYERDLIDTEFYNAANVEKVYNFSLIGGKTKNPREVYDAVIREFKSAKENGLSDEDIERVKKYIMGSHIKMYNSPQKIGNNLTRSILRGTHMFETLPVLDSITKRDIETVLHDFYNLDDNVLSIIEPEN
jgi:predicted Zn-dependent peptidase